MYTSELALHYTATTPINSNSPEIRFLEHISSGGQDVESFFLPKTSSGRDIAVYAPNGEFVGIDAVRVFAKQWLLYPGAEKATIHPVIQTVAGGRSVTEMEVWFTLADGSVYKVPMAVFADLAPDNKLWGLRIYYFFNGSQAHRRTAGPFSDLRSMHRQKRH